MPSICPGGGDDSPFLGCFPNAFLCNLASDCPGGIDEDNCTDTGNHLTSVHDKSQAQTVIISPGSV